MTNRNEAFGIPTREPLSGIPLDTNAASSSHNTELAVITVSAKIPDFWTEMPRLWFAQFETIMAPQKQGEESKFNIVVSKLGKDSIQQISDILMQPPTEKRYQVLKERLLAVYEESEERQFQKLVSEIELGDQKPSQLLRRMKELAQNARVSEQTLRSLWTTRLPTHVRAVLTVSQDQSLDNLAAIADKIMENSRMGEIADLSNTSQLPLMTELLSQINKLSLEVAALRGQTQNERRRFNGFRNRSRSRSRSRGPTRTPESPNWLCRFHFRYRNRARTCEQPCNWKKQPEN